MTDNGIAAKFFTYFFTVRWSVRQSNGQKPIYFGNTLPEIKEVRYEGIKPKTKGDGDQAFLQGYIYNDICHKVGIGKGSAISIIDDFREGGIQLTPEITEYIDELRRPAVDLKKQDTNAAESRLC